MSWIGQPAVTIAEAVRSRRVTATEVVGEHLDHIDRLDGRVGAFVLTRRDEALAEAARLDERADLDALPLAGVPVAVKDVVDLVGHPTRHGSVGTSAEPATEDDRTVARLKAAGAIVVGKTRCPELSIWGTSDAADGTARNPWDLQRTPGGSSGGSGAAVAAGMVPIALASDGMGSVRIPAACNGILGIKPGSGVVPITFGDHDEHWSGMTEYGPLATTVADLALMLDVLAGGAGLADVVPPEGSLRIGVSTAAVMPGTMVTREWREATTRIGDLLAEAGHAVVRQKVPYTLPDAAASITRWWKGADDDLEVLGVDRSRIQPRTRRHAAAGRALHRVLPARPAQAQAFRARVAEMFEGIDVLVTPGLLRHPITADGWRDRGWLSNFLANALYASLTPPWNLASVPAAAVPAGLAGNGLPLSVQVIAPHGQEARVLAVAAQLEQLQPWPRHAPLAGADRADVA